MDPDRPLARRKLELYYGLLILLERFVLARALPRIPKVIRILVTFFFAMTGWILFYHTSLSAGFGHLLALFGVGVQGTDAGVKEVLSKYTVLPLIAAVCSLPIVPGVGGEASRAQNRAQYRRSDLRDGAVRAFARVPRRAEL